jgi:glutamate-5-semialdehyde dehydrogenase
VELDRGLELYQVTCPLGVVGVIFESRPDALIQIAALCLKSGNAALLKGGREAAATNRVLADVIAAATASAGLPWGWMALLESRQEVAAILDCDQDIDLIIPRGSNAFVRQIMQNTRIPVMGHADGICHVYIDRAADTAMAIEVAVDSKVQYVAVCNAAETLLVHRRWSRSCQPPKSTGAPNTSTASSRSGWWTAWRRPSGTSTVTARVTPR